MPKQFCEISAPSWFYYKEICYDAWSHERKIVQCLCAYIQSDPQHADSMSRFHLRQIFNKLRSR
jgi:hypothetical protein